MRLSHRDMRPMRTGAVRPGYSDAPGYMDLDFDVMIGRPVYPTVGTETEARGIARLLRSERSRAGRLHAHPLVTLAALALAVLAILAGVEGVGPVLAVFPLLATAFSPEAEIAELAGVDMTVDKDWSKDPITVDGNWRRVYTAAVSRGFSLCARNVKAAIADARRMGGDWPDLVTLGSYETQVTDGPTGLYYRDYTPILDRADADISRNLVYVVRRPRETDASVIARLVDSLHAHPLVTLAALALAVVAVGAGVEGAGPVLAACAAVPPLGPSGCGRWG